MSSGDKAVEDVQKTGMSYAMDWGSKSLFNILDFSFISAFMSVLAYLHVVPWPQLP
jgi:hypothetical protein